MLETVAYFEVVSIDHDCTLTLKWSRSSVCPLVVKGGPYGHNIRNILFRMNFALKFGSLVEYSKKPKRSKKIENRTYGFKMAANKPFEISQHQLSRQKWEKHFPEGIFLRNLAHK